MIESEESDWICDYAQDSSIILRINGTAILNNLPVLEHEEYLGTFRYEFKGLKNLKAEWKVAKLGNLSSGCDDLRAIYGVQFILPGQDFSAGLTGQGRVEGMIFGFSDPNLGQILGFPRI